MKTVNPVTREVEFQKKDYTKRFSSKSIRRVREEEGREVEKGKEGAASEYHEGWRLSMLLLVIWKYGQ